MASNEESELAAEMGKLLERMQFDNRRHRETTEQKRAASPSIELEGKGRFEAYAATFGNVDRSGDAIVRGAFAKWMRENGDELPLCRNHDRSVLLGVVKCSEDSRGLKVVGQINLDSPDGIQAYQDMIPPDGFDNGGLASLSIGYRIHDDEVKGGVRYLKEIELLEISLVTIPANARARVLSVKADDDDEDDDPNLIAMLGELNEEIQWKNVIGHIRRNNFVMKSRMLRDVETLEDVERYLNL